MNAPSIYFSILKNRKRMSSIRTLILAAALSPLALLAQGGTSCSDAIPTTLGTHTAQADNYWYSFTADTSAMFHLSTCGLSTCDTKIWIYDHCAGLVVDEGGTNALGYNDDACSTLQSNVDVVLMEGHTYYIRIGDYNNVCNGAVEPWQIYHDTATPPPTCQSSEMLVSVVIVPDDFPNEISWDLTDGGGNLIQSGNYQGASICVDTSTCVVLTMHDGYGDGIYSPGGYWLYVDSVLIHQGGNYTPSGNRRSPPRRDERAGHPRSRRC